MPVLSLNELRKRVSGLFLDAGLGEEDTAALVDILISTCSRDLVIRLPTSRRIT